MADYPSGDDDDFDDFGALDFSSADDDAGSGLDAFDVYSPGAAADDDEDTGSGVFDAYPPAVDAAHHDDTGWPAVDYPTEQPAVERDPAWFTVTNPPGTVSVSVSLDGRVQDIDLSARAAAMTETDLAKEIVVIAELARQQARAAQYTFVLEGMRDMGQDTAEARDFLERSMCLPSPQEAQAATAQVFATRYASDHE